VGTGTIGFESGIDGGRSSLGNGIGGLQKSFIGGISKDLEGAGKCNSEPLGLLE
jgi:hypothetical protein